MIFDLDDFISKTVFSPYIFFLQTFFVVLAFLETTFFLETRMWKSLFLTGMWKSLFLPLFAIPFLQYLISFFLMYLFLFGLDGNGDVFYGILFLPWGEATLIILLVIFYVVVEKVSLLFLITTLAT
jgi:hypothetical protein